MTLKLVSGERFLDTRLTYLETICFGKRRKVKCECDCGNICDVGLDLIRQGKTRSCGCLHSEVVSSRMQIQMASHGLTSHWLYGRYRTMISRCEYKHHKDYEFYGAKGVTVCPEWRNDFVAFKTWVEEQGMTEMDTFDIHREDSTKSYGPETCQCLKREDHWSLEGLKKHKVVNV